MTAKNANLTKIIRNNVLFAKIVKDSWMENAKKINIVANKIAIYAVIMIKLMIVKMALKNVFNVNKIMYYKKTLLMKFSNVYK